MSYASIIVDKYHVATPVTQIMRDRYRRMNKIQRSREVREQRHEFWRAIIARHNENRGVYDRVMGGAHLECADLIQKHFGYTP